MSDEKKSRVLDAATAVFMRYGFKRTTMRDIAQEAGLSRPALYQTFSNKEDIFRGVIAQMSERAAAEIQARLPELDSLSAKLTCAFEVAFVRPFEVARKSPHAQELFESGHALLAPIIEEIYASVTELLVSIIESEPVELGRVGLTPAQLANILSLAARGAKHHASDPDQLRGVLAGLVRLAVAAVQPRGLDGAEDDAMQRVR